MEMSWAVEELKLFFLIFSLSMVRISAAFVLMPYLHKTTLGSSMIKNSILMSFSIILYPLVSAQYGQITMNGIFLFSIILKEALLGVLIGFIANIIFWAVESAGFIIDNQRGTTMASALNPMSGSQTSPLAIFLNQTLITLVFVSGIFLTLLSLIYQSYITWPIFSFFPTLNESVPVFFLHYFDFLLELAVLLAWPVVIAMFLSEFGFALVSRFAPQLNVFILSMPIKSMVAIGVLCVYIRIAMDFSLAELLELDATFDSLYQLLGP